MGSNQTEIRVGTEGFDGEGLEKSLILRRLNLDANELGL